MQHRSIFAILFACLIFTSTNTNAVFEKLQFGIVPQQTPAKLFRDWQPITAYISTQLGTQVMFVTAPTISEFETRCAQGKYDIAYMNPFHYVRFAKKPGYRVIANQSNKKLKGIFVVKSDTKIKSLADVDGKTIYFPSPNAFAASLLTQSLLRQRGIKYTPHFVGTHDIVYRNISLNMAPVGGGIVRTFNTQPEPLRKKLRILETTKGYTPHAFAVHPRVPDETVKKIQAILINLPAHLRAPLHFNPLQSADDKAYNDIRELNLQDLKSKIPNVQP